MKYYDLFIKCSTRASRDVRDMNFGVRIVTCILS